jgi:hypothetical protein
VSKRLVGTDLLGPDVPENAGYVINRVTVNRAVEWFKAPATFNGGVGTIGTGTLVAPTSGFERHAAVLNTLRTSWGIG